MKRNTKIKRRTNNYYCKTRAEHHCGYCGCIIQVGSVVRTISTKDDGRYWVCKECDHWDWSECFDWDEW